MPLPQLPLDVLIKILSYCVNDVKVLKNFLLSSRLFHEAASVPSLWEIPYRARYLHSDDANEEKRKAECKSNWREMYTARRRLDSKALDLLRSVVEAPSSRNEVLLDLIDMSLDVWDALSSESSSPILSNDPGNHERVGSYPLTWKYWAGAVAGGIAKRQVLDAWPPIFQQTPHAKETISFEDALSYASCFFGIPKQEVSRKLESLGENCKIFLVQKQHTLGPEYSDSVLPALCNDICLFMREEGFCMATYGRYAQLLNKFPHLYLSTHKETIPMSLVHIFVSLCRQIGIQAFPISFPGTVLANVPRKDTLPLAVNPSAIELHNAVLNERSDIVLDKSFPFSVFPGPHDDMLRACLDTGALLVRFHNNVQASMGDSRVIAGNRIGAALMSLCVGALVHDDNGIRHVLTEASILPFIDIFLLSKYLLPLLSPNKRQVLEFYWSDTLSSGQIQPKRRSPKGSPNYFVGMVMEHAKYHYQGVIYGWDYECKSNDVWISRMNVDQLPRGRHQPFYHIYTDSYSNASTYVAEENIIPIGLTSDAASSLLDKCPSLQRCFGDVVVSQQLGESEGVGRFLQSPESKLAYPDDEDFGSRFIGDTTL
ncbi:hypothetical protein FA15DRAFT_662973 [Coprinopsis marcescibilis]|uniref:Hemimethylated DNA-binding domain-containing protein n=1 Tax=Coprinopsis marcescibilis TaxID=230819 RepID=A0A5C3LDL1_COPMA|nr:hypothetical protein FA15DRAFT_662973 [Coprinopsis marcescibilis]